MCISYAMYFLWHKKCTLHWFVQFKYRIVGSLVSIKFDELALSRYWRKLNLAI